MVFSVELGELIRLGMDPVEAKTLVEGVSSRQSTSAGECWAWISREVLKPADPFALHEYLYERVFADWDDGQGPPPAWTPPPGYVETTNIHRFMRDLGLSSYGELHAWSLANRELFWERLIDYLGIRFSEPYSRIRDPESGVEAPGWLVDARLNIVDSCFGGDEDAPAVVYQPEGQPLQRLSYGELRALTERVAGSRR